MKPLPLGVRVAAGLAVTALEQARRLPQQLAGLPLTVVSEAMQLSMRVQQHVTELAIKGDDVLSGLRPAEDEPEWATFDEDETPVTTATSEAPADDPWEEEERAIAEVPEFLPMYDELSIAQLRARLRNLDVEQLEVLLRYEQAHESRPEFIGMLNRRILTVKRPNDPAQ
ncbi:lipid droplet-associated protein [Lentzea sp. BCCO 10_0856]|uniref:Lipid droplet-associated protein n=1 Tax=Lentzea miocenica TaxID=3095431 RepID=A0ABU4TGC8_9PSEU|nr:lipid droplet-associated protein [Lentzea sp. BCCO 10_0856]MDX8037249.1 lipid droplet-associated protein [Lentzea sp. BCCO 10_0856]